MVIFVLGSDLTCARGGDSVVCVVCNAVRDECSHTVFVRWVRTRRLLGWLGKCHVGVFRFADLHALGIVSSLAHFSPCRGLFSSS